MQNRHFDFQMGWEALAFIRTATAATSKKQNNFIKTGNSRTTGWPRVEPNVRLSFHYFDGYSRHEPGKIKTRSAAIRARRRVFLRRSSLISLLENLAG